MTIYELILLNLRVGVCTMLILQTNFQSEWGLSVLCLYALSHRVLLPYELHHFNSACVQGLIQRPSQMPTIHLVLGEEIETGEFKINVAAPTVYCHEPR